jgi:sensor histidine kinase regulating citrate/malate metabolism
MKNWSIRTKILIFVELMLLIFLGSIIFFHTRQLQQSYITAFEWRSEAFAKNIIAKIADLYALNPAVGDTLSVLSVDCLKLYESNTALQMSHVGVINTKNVMVAHNDTQFWGKPVSSPVLLEHLQHPALATILDGETYHTLVPVVMSPEGVFVGTIDIGFPKHLMDEVINTSLIHNIGIFLSFILLMMVLLPV